MESRPNIDDSRREFFRRLGRAGAGAGRAALTTVLLVRNGDATAAPACPNGEQCRRCGLARTCGLPAAEARRTASIREDDDA